MPVKRPRAAQGAAQIFHIMCYFPVGLQFRKHNAMYSVSQSCILDGIALKI